MNAAREYLVTYSQTGEIGRFQSAAVLDCQRGDRVVVRTPRGLELGAVLCDATERHATLLEGKAVGELLRRATSEDDAIAAGIRERSRRLLDDVRRMTAELVLPLEVLDVEITLDGHRVTLYHLRWAECDERPLVSALSKKYEAMVSMRDLALPAGANACGRPDCGNQGGNCTTCGTGGCSTGCGSKALSQEVQEYFRGLRQKMEQHNRVPLA
jgi:cell fate regulator YaaT (PSP1 superfamily)